MTSMTNAPSSRTAWQDKAVLWQHRALCGLALPMRAPKGGFWSRAAAGTSVSMGAEEATSAEAQLLPAGRVFRLLLLHLFSNALRGGTAAVEIGPDAAGVARSLGLELTSARLKEIEEQMER